MALVDFALVALGGAIGSAGRYGVRVGLDAAGQHQIGLATFTVNFVGSLVIGLLAGWLVANPDHVLSQNTKMLLVFGICGGFTTFSSFSFEVLTLLRSGQTWPAFTYITLSVLLCLGATALGYVLTSGGR
jgi:CrcB protein